MLHRGITMIQPYTHSLDLFDRLPSLLYRVTPDGRFLQVNQAMLQMSRYPNQDSLLACDLTDICVEWPSIITQNNPSNDFEFQFCCYDGTILWLRNNSYAVYDERGE